MNYTSMSSGAKGEPSTIAGSLRTAARKISISGLAARCFGEDDLQSGVSTLY